MMHTMEMLHPECYIFSFGEKKDNFAHKQLVSTEVIIPKANNKSNPMSSDKTSIFHHIKCTCYARYSINLVIQKLQKLVQRNGAN